MDDFESLLFQAVLALESEEDCRNFFSDLFTPEELTSIAKRWGALRLLCAGVKQREVAKRVGV